MERGVIFRNKQSSAEWSQVLIFSKVIASWRWLVSLLCDGVVGFYIDFLILRGDSVGLQYIWRLLTMQYVWCDEGCFKRFMVCIVVPTTRNL